MIVTLKSTLYVITVYWQITIDSFTFQKQAAVVQTLSSGMCSLTRFISSAFVDGCTYFQWLYKHKFHLRKKANGIKYIADYENSKFEWLKTRSVTSEYGVFTSQRCCDLLKETLSVAGLKMFCLNKDLMIGLLFLRLLIAWSWDRTLCAQ